MICNPFRSLRGAVESGLQTRVGRGFSLFLGLQLCVCAGPADAQTNTIAVRSVATTAAGKIVIGGDFTSYAGSPRLRVARLNADLRLDPSFDTTLGPDGPVFSVWVQGDGRVLIGGNFTNVAGIARARVARLNEDGSLDVSFDPRGGPDQVVRSVIGLDDGSAWAAGDFVLVDGFLRAGIVKLNTDGGVDLGFQGGYGTDGSVNAMSLQPDGKVIIAGSFSSFNNSNRTGIARLNTTGSLDGSFVVTDTPDGLIYAMALQPDGSVVLGGAFGNLGLNPRARVARVTSTGALDLSFDPGSGPNDIVTAVALQPNGKVVIGGAFTAVGGLARAYIARLSSGGTNDATFSVGTGANAPVTSLDAVGNAMIAVGGAFDTFDGVPRAGAALVAGDAPALTGVLRGTITDATQSPPQPLIGASVAVAGSVVTTDLLGRYSISNIAAGIPLTVVGTAPNYSTYFASLTLAAGVTNQLSFSMTPNLPFTNGMRFVLNWGANPYDLDSHLLTPYTNSFFFSGPHHVYFANRGSTNSPPFANLDVDVTFGFGPETITITSFTNGTYDYYIYNFSQDAPIAGSGATVKAYTPAGLVATVRAPTTGPIGAVYWHVFRIDGATRQISIVNSLSLSDPNQPGLPNFTLQPVSQTTRIGRPVTFTSLASGNAPLTYQWQFNGLNIPGATGPSLTITNAQSTNAGAYVVTASNPIGSVTSSTAYLGFRAGSVTPAVVSLTRNQTVLEGYSANFNVDASGLPLLRYQWQFNGADITDATNSTFTLYSARPQDAGDYSVAITNRLGGIVSVPIALTVISVPVIVADPVGTNITLGGQLNLSVNAIGSPPLTYRWRRAGFNVPNATNSTLTIPNALPSDAGDYEVIISNPAGATVSATASVRITGAPGIATPPQSMQVALGDAASFSVAVAGDSPFTYQWLFNGAPIAGGTTAMIIVTNVQPPSAGAYSVIVSNASGTALSAPAFLALIGAPEISIQPQPASAILGASASLSVTADGQPLLGYQWRRGGIDLAGETNATLTITNVLPATAGNYSVAIVNALGTTVSSNALVSITPPMLNLGLAPAPAGGPGLALTLPPEALGFILEVSPTLGAGAVWTTVTNLVTLPSGPISLPFDPSGGFRFFRLRTP